MLRPWEERQLHSSHVIKVEEFDFEYVCSKKKEKYSRINAFLSRSEHLNFVDTLTLAAILDFHFPYLILSLIYLKPRFVVLKASRCQGLFPSPNFQKRPRERGWPRCCLYIDTIEIIDIECVPLSFLSKNFVSTKWRAFWLVPDSCGKEFRAVAGSANRFFFNKVCKKKLYRD